MIGILKMIREAVSRHKLYVKAKHFDIGENPVMKRIKLKY